VAKFTLDDINLIMDSMPESDKKMHIHEEEDGGARLDLGEFLLNFANTIYDNLNVDSMERRIKLLEQEVAWAENGYTAKQSTPSSQDS